MFFLFFSTFFCEFPHSFVIAGTYLWGKKMIKKHCFTAYTANPFREGTRMWEVLKGDVTLCFFERFTTSLKNPVFTKFCQVYMYCFWIYSTLYLFSLLVWVQESQRFARSESPARTRPIAQGEPRRGSGLLHWKNFEVPIKCQIDGSCGILVGRHNARSRSFDFGGLTKPNVD